MGKSMVSKRSKGKVDFKRKEDPEDPDKKAVENNDEEEKIVFIMKKCKVMMPETNDSFIDSSFLSDHSRRGHFGQAKVLEEETRWPADKGRVPGGGQGD